eukprot:1818912-Prymnesium_polylepis.1
MSLLLARCTASTRLAPVGDALAALRRTLLVTLEASALLLLVAIAHFAMPHLPQVHDPQLFWGTLILTFLVCALWRRPLPTDGGPLDRELTTEWRGWMQ